MVSTLNPVSLSYRLLLQVVQGYIDDLLRHEAYEAAAQLSPRLLKDNASMWERWVYLFAQTRQLPKLAKYIPTGEGGGPARRCAGGVARAVGKHCHG